MSWSVGDKVMAKWPGSGLYYHAEVLSIDDDSVEVLYSDGTTMEIPVKFVKSERSFAQRKHSKSPSRSRRRSRSPGRSPSRKSQSKKANETVKPPKSRSVSRGRAAAKSSPTKTKKSTRSSSRGRRSVVTSTTTSTTSSSGAKETVTVKRVEVRTVKNTVDPETRSVITRQRARAAFALEEAASFKVDDHVGYEFGGVFGAFLMYFTMPLSLCMLLVITKANWSVSKFNKSMIPCNWEAYFNVQSFLIVLGFMIFHAVIYYLPFGYILKGPATSYGVRLNYRISARYTLALTAFTYWLFHYYNVPLQVLHDDQFRIAVAATVISIVGTLLVYIASFWAPKEEINPGGNTGSILYDSFIGRWQHPRVGELFDLKLYLYRPAMAGWLVVIWVEMARDYGLHGASHSLPFLLVAVSQIIYCIFEFFYDEDQCPYMFDIKNESLGFVQFFGELVIVPFIYTIPVKYLVDHPYKLHPLNGAIFVALTILGYYLIVVSGKQKSSFRKNPFDHKLSGFESLPSTRPGGDRLLISGLWKFVRHPHYLGEILLGFSWSFICGFKHLLPWYYPVLITLLLCHRCFRVEARNVRKHGHSWKMYQEKVKYRIFPGIF